MKHIILGDNNSSIVTQSKHFDNKPQDKQEYDHRQYRYLVTIFADNINRIAKMSKDCLGDLQFHPKYKVSNEVQEMFEPYLLNIYEKYKDRISKETKYRNTIIKKTCQSYLNQYQKVHPSSQSTINLNKNNLSSFLFIKKIGYSDKKSLLKSFKSQTRKTISAETTQDKSYYQALKSFQTDIPSELKFKTVSSDNSTREYFFKTRSAMSRNQRKRVRSDSMSAKGRLKSSQKYNRKENIQDRMQNQNQILIRDNRRSYNEDEEWQYDKQVAVKNKFCTKRVVAIGQSQKKAIQDIELLHLQTNNVCISKAFQTLPSHSSTYRPKTKNRLLKEYN